MASAQLFPDVQWTNVNFGPAQGRQEEGCQNYNDGNDHQQLNEREASRFAPLIVTIPPCS